SCEVERSGTEQDLRLKVVEGIFSASEPIRREQPDTSCAESTWSGLCPGEPAAIDVQWEGSAPSAGIGNDTDRDLGSATRDKPMTTKMQRWFAGVDWASAKDDVALTDADGKSIARRTFEHSGTGLAHMSDWLVRESRSEPHDDFVAIETPHGAVVEVLIERGFRVHAINPKQLDRFRDRFTVAGAKDDRRDADVLASALRTDAKAFRVIEPA